MCRAFLLIKGVGLWSAYAEAEYLLLDVRMHDPRVQDVKKFLDIKHNVYKLIYCKNNIYLYKK
jgi:hypothetical protein